MKQEILINSTPQESRIAIIEDGLLAEFLIERKEEMGIAGNIYKGKVVRVLPGMQAAFVEIGLEKAAFLHASDLAGADAPLPPEVAQQEGEAPEIVEEPPKPARDERPIEERLQKGQEVLVQVSKEPMGTKGA